MTVPVVDAQSLVDAIEVAMAGIAYAEGKKPAVVAPGAPYVVVWFSDVATDKSLRSRDGYELTATFQCYGSAPDSVRFAVHKVRAAVLSLHRATIGGRTVHMPEHLPGPPMQRDDDVNPPLWWQADEWRLRTSA